MDREGNFGGNRTDAGWGFRGFWESYIETDGQFSYGIYDGIVNSLNL